LRIGGKLPAILTLVGDLLKGFLRIDCLCFGGMGLYAALVALAAV